MTAKRKTPPELLKPLAPTTQKLARLLSIQLGYDVSRYSTYGLINPALYPAPVQLFDTRTGFAEKISALIDYPVDKLRDFYMTHNPPPKRV